MGSLPMAVRHVGKDWIFQLGRAVPVASEPVGIALLKKVKFAISAVLCWVPGQAQDAQQSHLDSRGPELWLKPLNLSWMGGPYKRNGPSEDQKSMLQPQAVELWMVVSHEWGIGT